MSNVMCVRLIGGEELIGQVTIVDDATLTISDPAAVMIVPGQSSASQFNIGLMPWLPYSDDDTFSISRQLVLTVHNPSVDLLNNYNRMFGSGIQIAGAGSLK